MGSEMCIRDRCTGSRAGIENDGRGCKILQQIKKTGSGRKARLSISGTSGIIERVRYHLQLSEQECDFAV